MSFSEAVVSHPEEISDEIVAAIAIIQLGLPRLPDNKTIFEVASQHNDARHIQITEMLRAINIAAIDDNILIRLSALVHLSCDWAWHYRLGKKTGFVTKVYAKHIRWSYRASSSSRELRRILSLTSKSGDLALAKAIVDLSPHTFDELRRAAAEFGIKFDGPSSLLCRECMRKASQRALQRLSTGRPQLREMDRAARAVKLAYQAVTGKTGSGRSTSPESKADAGRPTGELHSLLLKIGLIYHVKLVTAASDGRLRKLSKSGVKTTFQ